MTDNVKKIPILLKVVEKDVAGGKIPLKKKVIEFRVIPGTSCSASSMGEIRNDLTGVLLPQKLTKDGYCQVSRSGLPSGRVHRLVALAFLANPNKYDMVDHINRIRNDNRLVNLQWVNNSLNQLNRTKKKNASSQYYGVTRRKSKTGTSKWQAYIKVEKKTVHLGTYNTEIEAGKAYNNFVIASQLKNQLNKL